MFALGLMWKRSWGMHFSPKYLLFQKCFFLYVGSGDCLIEVASLPSTFSCRFFFSFPSLHLFVSYIQEAHTHTQLIINFKVLHYCISNIRRNIRLSHFVNWKECTGDNDPGDWCTPIQYEWLVTTPKPHPQTYIHTHTHTYTYTHTHTHTHIHSNT